MRRRIVGAVTGVASTMFLASCGRNAPQDTFQPKGPNAKIIDDLQKPVFAVAGIIGVFVTVVVIIAVFKYRDKGQPIPHQSHGNPALEITLTIIPALILTVVGVFTFRTVFDLAKTSDTEMIINVTGQQWWWEYDYPVQNEYGITQPIITSGQLVIPAGTKVLLRQTSRDVIHSYWIPALNGKRDAVPGRVHLNRIEADKPGIYAGQCTEFCGLSHANMRMEAVALSKADFAKWVANQLKPYTSPAENTLAKEGETVFMNQCVRCHQVNGMKRADGTPVIAAPDENMVSGAAPNLSHLMSRNTFAGATFDLLNKSCRNQRMLAAYERQRLSAQLNKFNLVYSGERYPQPKVEQKISRHARQALVSKNKVHAKRSTTGGNRRQGNAGGLVANHFGKFIHDYQHLRFR